MEKEAKIFGIDCMASCLFGLARIAPNDARPLHPPPALCGGRPSEGTRAPSTTVAVGRSGSDVLLRSTRDDETSRTWRRSSTKT